MAEPKTWTAADLMTRSVLTIRAADSVDRLAKLLSDKKIGGVPVLDASGRLVGVVSKSDLVKNWGKELSARVEDFFELPGDEFQGSEDDAPRRVMDVMSRGLITVPPDAAASEIAKLMLERRIHRVLVTRGAELLGVVSSLDVLKAIAEP